MCQCQLISDVRNLDACMVVSLLQDKDFSWGLHCFIGRARGLIALSVRCFNFLHFTARV